MVKESVDLLELLRKQTDGADLDFLREAVAVLAEAVMDAEVSAQIGAAHGERSETRLTRRNGYGKSGQVGLAAQNGREERFSRAGSMK